jgi:hypothetical protein
VPSRSLYPHQWSWDSAFVAIGLRHLSPDRARWELESLFDAQWADGRIPQIVFSPNVPRDAYFPGPDFWNAATPSGQETSGIVQPPVHALAAWLVHQADPAPEFLADVYPRLVAWHRYLRERRDLGGRGLVAIVHPWESGMDNSPAWDAPLARVEPAPADSFTRTDINHARAEDRPTDLDYGRFVRLASTYRDHEYDDRRTPFAFAVEDPAFNALLIASDHALAAIAVALGNDPEPHLTDAKAHTEALAALFVDQPPADGDPSYDAQGIFRVRDVVSGELVPVDGIAGLVPLLVPDLPVAGKLLATLRGSRFRLGAVHLVPSYDLTGPAFEPGRYWRGPSWFNTAWLIHRALTQLAGAATEVSAAERLTAEAVALRNNFVSLAGSTRLAEYVDPFTGEPHGAIDYSWTAALTLDLLNEQPIQP